MPAILQYRAIRWTLFAVSSLLALLILAEIGARIVWDKKDPLSFCKLPPSAGDRSLLEFDAAAGWRLRPNLEEQSAFGTVFYTNERGLRMDHLMPYKPPTRIRVACFGDEIGFGANIAGSPYPALLEGALRREFPDADIEVANLSVPGYSILRIEQRLKDTIAWLRPDVVILQSFANDVAIQGVRDSQLTSAGNWERTLRRCAPFSRLACGLLEKREAARANSPLDSAGLRRVCMEDYLWSALRIRDFCRANGVIFQMVAPLWKRPNAEGATQEQRCLIEYAGRIRDLGIWHNVPLHNPLEGEGADSAFLPGENPMPSDIGHARIAKGVLDSIRLRVWNRLNELAEAYPKKIKTVDY